MTTQCPIIDQTLVASHNAIKSVMVQMDTAHDMAQNRQDGDLKPASRAAVAAHMRNDPNNANILPSDKYDLETGSTGKLQVPTHIQTELNEAVDDLTKGIFTSIGGDTGQSYEQKGHLSLYQPDMKVSVQRLMHNALIWSSLPKPQRTANANVWLTGYRNQQAKTIDQSKTLDTYYNGIDLTNTPIGTTPLVGNPMSCWGSVNITWGDSEQGDDVPTKLDGTPYYSFDVFKNSNLQRIADFMVTFMFPDTETPVERGGFVIDGGGAGCLRAMSALPQITAIICPAVVGDSAPLCPHNIGGRGHARNAYSFADAITKDEFLEKSNVSSDGFQDYTTKFYYQRDTATTGIYDENTYSTFNYVIEVYGNGINVTGVFPFTQKGPSMGPSVPYIAALIHAARSNATGGYGAIIGALSGVTPKGKVLSLGSFPVDLFKALQGSGQNMNIALQLFERICFDIKRCGDWEQVESVNAIAKQNPEIGVTMLGTGDILCMSQARLQGLCGIWHNEKKIPGKNEDEDEEDNSFGSGGNPEAWNIVAFRNPQNVDENAISLFNIRDIVGKLQKPLQIIANNCLASTVSKLDGLRGKCTTGIGLLCTQSPEGIIGSAKALSSINLSNIVQKCQINIQLLSPPQLPSDFDINKILQLSLDFSSEYTTDLTNPGQEDNLVVFVEKYRALLGQKQFADILNPYIEMITTALYSFGCSYESVTNLCENAEPISDTELDAIFGPDDTLPVNPDGSVNINFIINDEFGYFAVWHSNIYQGRAKINDILQQDEPSVDNTNSISVADFVEHFNTEVLGPLKTIMLSNYAIDITRIVAASDKGVIKAVNKNYKLKSLDNFPVPSRVSGGRRVATPEQLQDIVQKVRNTKAALDKWFLDGNNYSVDLCRLATGTGTAIGGGSRKQLKGGILSNGDPNDYSDAVENYFDMLIQEVMGYLKLCENGDPASPLQSEGFSKARNAFCNGTARNGDDGQLTYGPQLPPEQVGLLDPYYDDTTQNIMSFFRSQFFCQGGQATQENINSCIEVRKALEALWSYDAATIERNAKECIALNDNIIANSDAFVERAVYNVIDPNTNIPRAFHKSDWQRTIFGGNKIIGRVAGNGSFGLLSPYWPGIFQVMSNPDDPASTADFVEFIENDMGLYADNYSSPIEMAISEYINEILPMINEIDFTLPLDQTEQQRPVNMAEDVTGDVAGDMAAATTSRPDAAIQTEDPVPRGYGNQKEEADEVPIYQQQFSDSPVTADTFAPTGHAQGQKRSREDTGLDAELAKQLQEEEVIRAKRARRQEQRNWSNWLEDENAGSALQNLFSPQGLGFAPQTAVQAFGGRKKMTKKRNKKKKMTKKKGKGKKNSKSKKKMTKKHNKKNKKTRSRCKRKNKGRKKSGGTGMGEDLAVPFSKLEV